MIWLLDLDNTLVSRDDAFASWAAAGGTDDDVAALLEADGGGFAPKRDVARVIVDRLGRDVAADDLDGLDAVVEEFRAGIRDHVRLYDGLTETLGVLRGAGHRVAIVTNGVSHQQHGKIERCGLAGLVDAVVVSGEEGVEKPDPRLLEIALARLDATDADRRRVWMIGDAAHADVAAGRAAGTRTGWVSHGRPWTGGARPDVVAPTAREVVALAAEPHWRPSPA